MNEETEKQNIRSMNESMNESMNQSINQSKMPKTSIFLTFSQGGRGGGTLGTLGTNRIALKLKAGPSRGGDTPYKVWGPGLKGGPDSGP